MMQKRASIMSKNATTVESKKSQTLNASKAAEKADNASRTVKGKTKEQLSKEIKDLLAQLEEATETDEKKTIRRGLRARGHYGGLGIRSPRQSKNVAAPAAKKGVPASPAKKGGRRAIVAPAPVVSAETPNLSGTAA